MSGAATKLSLLFVTVVVRAIGCLCDSGLSSALESVTLNSSMLDNWIRGYGSSEQNMFILIVQ